MIILYFAGTMLGVAALAWGGPYVTRWIYDKFQRHGMTLAEWDAEYGVDGQIASLTKRYVHGDLTLDEFEEQVDMALRGEFAYQLDPWLANKPGAVWVTDKPITYPMAGGTASYNPFAGTAQLSDVQRDQFAAWVEERDRIEDAKMKKEKIDKLRGSEGWPT